MTTRRKEEFHSKNYHFPCQVSFKRYTTKIKLLNGKSYVKKLHTRLSLQMPLHVPEELRTVTQPQHQPQIVTFFLARTMES